MNTFSATVFCIKIPANSVDPDQRRHFAASELGLHCLNMSPKWVYSLKWVNTCIHISLDMFEVLSVTRTYSLFMVTFKAPVTTAADDIHIYFFIFFQRK